MLLTKLIAETKAIKIIGWIEEINIEGISISSRKKGNNILFVAQSGGNFDGHNFVEEAIINGAVALVVEKELPSFNIPQIVVKSTRIAITTLASTFYGNPKDKLKFLGVTGTNGKTSCALFLSKILNDAGKKCGYIGTTGAKLCEKEYPTALTTPDPLVFHKLLNEMVEDGAEYVAMEVSAHAIALEKLCNINFEVGIITNITQDHLDFFKTMKNYSKTKLDWLKSKNVKTAIINADDKFCHNLLNKKEQLLTYGLDNPSDVFCVNIEKHLDITSFVMNLLDNVITCHTKLLGMFNIYNIMAVATGALCVGVSVKEIQNSIKTLTAPTGRFNVIHLKDDKTIIVDFAHTPDGLENALKSARDICKGSLISLFGCGGDRDTLKRPIMGEIAENLSDFSIITSDNPRFEKPEKILEEIEKGMKKQNYIKIADRKLAIFKIVEMLRPGDVAVVCGKGGEKYQDINGIKLPYDDFDEIQKSVKTIFGEDCTVEVKTKIC